MKRVLILFLAVVSLSTMACNLTGAGVVTNGTSAGGAGNSSAAGAGTIIAATSSIPTGTPRASANGNSLAAGTLILSQRGNPLAQAPNATGETVSLPAERFGSQASGDGRYGVRFKPNNGKFDLTLIDFSTGTPA